VKRVQLGAMLPEPRLQREVRNAGVGDARTRAHMTADRGNVRNRRNSVTVRNLPLQQSRLGCGSQGWGTLHTLLFASRECVRNCNLQAAVATHEQSFLYHNRSSSWRGQRKVQGFLESDLTHSLLGRYYRTLAFLHTTFICLHASTRSHSLQFALRFESGNV